MNLHMMNKYKTGLFILFSAIFIQLIFILYKDFTNYVPIESLTHFLVMWTSASFISALFLGGLWIIDKSIITVFDSILVWEYNSFARFILESCIALFVGICVGLIVTLLSDLIFGYDQPLAEVLLYNAIITAVINFILVSIAETVQQYKKHQASLIQAEKLKRENTDMRFQALKQQLDPHFLFNSLNVLAHLVQKEPEKAQHFIEQFSTVYRYVLEVVDSPIVSVEKEIEFIKSYLYLQSIRFGDNIKIKIDIEKDAYNKYIPPLSIQILLENAFKHNVIKKDLPLNLNIYTEQNRLYVINSYQPKKRNMFSRQMGLENLVNRYKLIYDRVPEIEKTKNEFKANIPLIEPE